MANDVIDLAAGINVGAPLDALRSERADIRKHAQGSHDALFSPADDAGLSLAERYAVALRIARSDGAEGLAAFYRERLVAEVGRDIVGEWEEARAPGNRLARLLDHTDLLISRPADATPEHLAPLTEAGLSTRAIVVLTQLIGYVSFQTRLVAGLQLLNK